MSYTDYHIVQGDTLESIAQDQLGSAEFWRQLAIVNRLRAPYISDSPIDQYAQAVVSATATAITAGALSYTVTLPAYATTYSKGTTFYIQQQTATSIVYDALKLSADINEATGVITFTTAFANTYPAGLTYYIFPNPNEVGTIVLKTGDVLHIPAGLTDNQTSATGSSSFIDQLGTDIWLDNDGFVSFDSFGDLVTTSGTKNLTQALAIRLKTPYGSLFHHATFGNKLFQYIGTQTSQYFLNLAQGIARATVVADPRVADIVALTATASGSVVGIDLSLTISRSSGLLRVDNLVLNLV